MGFLFSIFFFSLRVGKGKRKKGKSGLWNDRPREESEERDKKVRRDKKASLACGMTNHSRNGRWAIIYIEGLYRVSGEK